MGAIISTKSAGEAGWQQGGRHIWCSLRWRTRIGMRPGKAAGGRCSSTHLCTAGGCPPADTPSPNCCASPHACTAAQVFAHARWVARPCLNRRGWLGQRRLLHSTAGRAAPLKGHESSGWRRPRPHARRPYLHTEGCASCRLKCRKVANACRDWGERPAFMLIRGQGERQVVSCTR